MSFLYRALLGILGLVARGRGDSANEVELLVFRHEVASSVVRWRVPRFRPADRASGGARQGSCRGSDGPPSGSPETVRRWHREALARRGTYPRRGSGAPPLD